MISPLDYLYHVKDEIDFIIQESKTMAVKIFLDDSIKNTDINWRSIAGMRDKLIHEYFGIDCDIVWDVIQQKIPELKPIIYSLISKLESEKEE